MNNADSFDAPGDGPFNRAALQNLPVIGRFFKKGPKVPVLRLSGILADASMRRGGISLARVSKQIDKAFVMQKVPAVVLVINSPGGAPAQAQLIAGMIRSLADEKQISVFAFVEDVAASGGYWLACAADQIYAQDTSIVGSIGVISASFGLDEFIARHGIKRRLYTAGREKSMLDPFLPEKAEDVLRLREVQAGIHEGFIAWVKDRRGSRLNGRDEELFQGRFWTGSVALDMGLIDAIGDMRRVMREKYGEDIRFIDLNPDKKFPFLPKGLVAIENWADDLMEMVEDRSLWSRFGL